MRNIWRIFCADWKRLTASVVAVVVMLVTMRPAATSLVVAVGNRREGPMPAARGRSRRSIGHAARIIDVRARGVAKAVARWPVDTVGARRLAPPCLALI